MVHKATQQLDLRSILFLFHYEPQFRKHNSLQSVDRHWDPQFLNSFLPAI